MTERVHPVCTRECTHNLAVPAYVDDPRAEIVWAAPPVVVDRCGACGYDLSTHDPGGACHIATADKNGRRGKWKPAASDDRAPWHEIIRRDALKRAADYAAAHATYEPTVIPPPRIPARAPRGPGEIAGYGGRQAVGLGKKAAAAGWRVAAYYAMRHDGEEFCAVKMARDDLFAVATWTRKPGNQGTKGGWGADIAYGVRRGDAPIKMTHTQLEGVIAA